MARIRIDENTLRNNYSKLVRKYNYVIPTDDNNVLEVVNPTHTFCLYNGKKKTYRDILFKDVGLLSWEYRNKIKREKRSRNVPKIVSDYVFAYLGVHEPYYANDLRPFPAVGVFIKTDIEKYPYCIPSRRDLKSDDVDRNLMNEFMMAEDARKFVSLQIKNSDFHNNDFWHYWGTGELWQDSDYAKTHWEHVAEFHYFEKVNITDFAAILWPKDEVVLENNNYMDSSINDEFTQLSNVLDKCMFIPYEWDPSDPELSFINASMKVTEYYIKNSKFPRFV